MRAIFAGDISLGMNLPLCGVSICIMFLIIGRSSSTLSGIGWSTVTTLFRRKVHYRVKQENIDRKRQTSYNYHMACIAPHVSLRAVIHGCID